MVTLCWARASTTLGIVHPCALWMVMAKVTSIENAGLVCTVYNEVGPWIAEKRSLLHEGFALIGMEIYRDCAFLENSKLPFAFERDFSCGIKDLHQKLNINRTWWRVKYSFRSRWNIWTLNKHAPVGRLSPDSEWAMSDSVWFSCHSVRWISSYRLSSTWWVRRVRVLNCKQQFFFLTAYLHCCPTTKSMMLYAI